MARKPTDTVQLKLRFPEALRRRISAKAKKNRLSMNTEIIHRLIDSLDGEEYFAKESLEAALDQVQGAGFTVVGPADAGASPAVGLAVEVAGLRRAADRLRVEMERVERRLAEMSPDSPDQVYEPPLGWLTRLPSK